MTQENRRKALAELELELERAQNAQLKDYLEGLYTTLADGHRHQDFKKFLSYFYDKTYSLLDYLPQGTPVFFDDFQKLTDRNAKLNLEIANYLTENLQQAKAVSNQVYFVDIFQDLRNYQPATFFSNFHKGLGNIRFQKVYNFTQYAMQEFFNQLPLLVDEVNRYLKTGATVILQADSQSKLEKLQEDLREYACNLPIVPSDGIVEGQAQLSQASLTNGFYFADQKLVLITEKKFSTRPLKGGFVGKTSAMLSDLRTTMSCKRVAMWSIMSMVLGVFWELEPLKLRACTGTI